MGFDYIDIENAETVKSFILKHLLLLVGYRRRPMLLRQNSLDYMLWFSQNFLRLFDAIPSYHHFSTPVTILEF
jgi:hypothetical protein